MPAREPFLHKIPKIEKGLSVEEDGENRQIQNDEQRRTLKRPIGAPNKRGRNSVLGKSNRFL